MTRPKARKAIKELRNPNRTYPVLTLEKICDIMALMISELDKHCNMAGESKNTCNS